MNYLSVIYAFISTAGFAVLFNIPRKHIFQASLTGAIGWFIYSYINFNFNSVFLAGFLSALTIGILGELSARIYKQPATVFFVPGIIPIVPGYSLYYTMLQIIQKDYHQATEVGFEALVISTMIASGIIVASSFGSIYSKKIKKRV